MCATQTKTNIFCLSLIKLTYKNCFDTALTYTAQRQIYRTKALKYFSKNKFICKTILYVIYMPIGGFDS